MIVGRVGQTLVKAFVDEAATRGCKCVYLTTDQAENERVNRGSTRNAASDYAIASQDPVVVS